MNRAENALVSCLLSLVSYSCSIGSEGRGRAEGILLSYKMSICGSVWVFHGSRMPRSPLGSFIMGKYVRPERWAASGAPQFRICGGRGCFMVGKRYKKGSQNGCYWGSGRGDLRLQETPGQSPGRDSTVPWG